MMWTKRKKNEGKKKEEEEVGRSEGNQEGRFRTPGTFVGPWVLLPKDHVRADFTGSRLDFSRRDIDPIFRGGSGPSNI